MVPNAIQEAEAMPAFEHVAKKERDGSAQKYEEKCRARPFSGARCMPSRAPPCLPGQVHLRKTSKRLFPGCVKLGERFTFCSPYCMYENTIVSIPYSHNLWKTLSEALCTTILPPESAIIHPTDRPSDQLGNRGSPNKANPERGKTGSLGSLGSGDRRLCVWDTSCNW